jgi:uncharacterized protein (DUF58 family)
MLGFRRPSDTKAAARRPDPDGGDRVAVQARAERLAGQLPPLLVEAERVAATVAQGVHGRRRVGTGESFWQFRAYQPGDPINRIDWRQTAKTQGTYVREQEWEAAQTLWLWRDAGASMTWTSDRSRLPTKAHRASVLLLAVAALLARAGERVALLDGEAPPSSGRSDLARLAAALEAPPALAGPAPGLPPARPLPRHGEVVLFGDFLAPLPEIERSLTGFAARGVRGHLVQILDPAEATLPYHGRVRFAGMEDDAEDVLVPRVDGIRDAYIERLVAQQAGLEAMARAAGWSYAWHRTDRPAQAALLALYGALSGVAMPAAQAAEA